MLEQLQCLVLQTENLCKQKAQNNDSMFRGHLQAGVLCLGVPLRCVPMTIKSVL